jgi:hypothetical protein
MRGNIAVPRNSYQKSLLLPLSIKFIIEVYAISPLLFSRLYHFRIIDLRDHDRGTIDDSIKY